MKKLGLLILAVAIVAGACLLYKHMGPSGPVVFVQPQSQRATVGSAIDVQIAVKHVNDLAGYQLDLTYDPDILQFTQARKGAFLSQGGAATHFIPPRRSDAGQLRLLAEARLGPDSASGSGNLAALTFTVRTTGISAIHLTNVKLAGRAAANIDTATRHGRVVVK